MINRILEKINPFSIIVLCLITRIGFKLISGYNNYDLFPDSYRYDRLSNDIINSNANMDIVAYLAAPLYSYLLALIKSIFNYNWEIATVAFQFILVAFSAVYISKIADLLFGKKDISAIAVLIYIFYPLTLWYNFTFTQETVFQCFFIFFTYHFLASIKNSDYRQTIFAALFYGLAYLTKSHIILLWPFIIILYIISRKVIPALIFTLIALAMSIPHGSENLSKHNIYTISSHGNASLFLLGHSDQTFDCLMARAGNMGDFSAEGCNPDFVFNRHYNFPKYGKVNQLSVKERNSVRFKIAFDWIKENPGKFIQLKLFGMQRFLLPGLDWRQYKFSYWLVSFIIGCLVYFPAYYMLARHLKQDDMTLHGYTLAVIIITASIFLIFFPINRFRVITMDPLMTVYAAAWYTRLLKKMSWLKT